HDGQPGVPKLGSGEKQGGGLFGSHVLTASTKYVTVHKEVSRIKHVNACAYTHTHTHTQRHTHTNTHTQTHTYTHTHTQTHIYCTCTHISPLPPPKLTHIPLHPSFPPSPVLSLSSQCSLCHSYSPRG